MTEKVYYKDQYLTELEAEILQIEGTRVLLDKTIFIPASNTEPGDCGKVGEVKISGLKKENDDIWHILSRQAPFRVGQKIKLELDWQKRFLAMRLHSALHLLAGPFDKDFAKRAVAGAIKGSEAYLIFKEEIDNELVEKALAQANKDIQKGLEIKSYWDEKRASFRWTQVGDYPAIPDGGLHIKNTKEIGGITLKEILNENNQTKLVFVVANDIKS